MAADVDTDRDQARRIPPALDWMAGMAWRMVLVGGTMWLLAVVLLRIRVVVLPVFAALLLTTLLHVPVDHLTRRGLPRLLATWMVLLPLLGAIVGGIWAIVPALAGQFSELGDEIVQGLEQLRVYAKGDPFNLSDSQIDSLTSQARRAFQGQSSSIASGVLAGAVLAVEAIAGLVLTMFLTFFFVKDGPRMWQWLLQLVDRSRREEAQVLGDRAWTALRGYMGGSAVAGVVEAAITGVVLAVVGVPLVIPIMVLFFIAPFFPIVGAVVAGAIAALLALVSGGVTQALIVVALVVVIQQVEGDLLLPLILGRAIQLHPVVVMLVLTAGGVLAGIIGAFMAVPVAAAVTAMAAELRDRRWDRDEDL